MCYRCKVAPGFSPLAQICEFLFLKGELINRVAFEVPDNIDAIRFRNDFAYGYDYEDNAIVVYEYEEVRK